jgi:hypothetical protein
LRSNATKTSLVAPGRNDIGPPLTAARRRPVFPSSLRLAAMTLARR